MSDTTYTIAQIAEIYTDGVTLIFPDSDEPTQKHYKCNTSAELKVGDRVKVYEDSGSYIVEYAIGAPNSGGDSHGLPMGGTTGQLLAKTSAADYDATWQDPTHELPTGGNRGQILAKNSGDDYDVKWADSTIPTGGSAGQALVKKSNADNDTQWSDLPHGIPSGGSSGQVLTKDGGTSYSAKWSDAPHELPTGGTAGQILTKNSSTAYDAKWADASVPTSVANHYSTTTPSNAVYNIYFKTDKTYSPTKLYWRMGTSGTWHEITST